MPTFYPPDSTESAAVLDEYAFDRGAPGYGEDNQYVYGELLGMSSLEIKALAEDGVI